MDGTRNMKTAGSRFIVMETIHMDKLMSKLEDFILDTLQFAPISAAGLVRRVEVMDLIGVIRNKFQHSPVPRHNSISSNHGNHGNNGDKAGKPLVMDAITVSRIPAASVKPEPEVDRQTSSCHAQNTASNETHTNAADKSTATLKDIAQESTGEDTDPLLVLDPDKSKHDPFSCAGVRGEDKPEEEVDTDACSIVTDATDMSFDSNNDDLRSNASTLTLGDADPEPESPWGRDASEESSSEEEEMWPDVEEIPGPRRRQSTLISLVDNMITIPEERLSVLSLSIASEREDEGDEGSVRDRRDNDDTISLSSNASTLLECLSESETDDSKDDRNSRYPPPQISLTPPIEDAGKIDTEADDMTEYILKRTLVMKEFHLQVEETRTLDVLGENETPGCGVRGEPPWSHKSRRPCQRITYCNPLESKFVDNFILLPKNKKSNAARLMSYSPRLREGLFRKASDITRMGSMKMDLSDAVVEDIVCQSGLVNPDYRGWLLDVVTGQRKWCVVADMLFCLFNDQHDEKPMKTLLLPGHEIKGIVYNSAKRGAFPETSHGDSSHHTRAHKNTISGQNRYQFVVENQCTQEEHVFGAESQDELDVWMSILKVATNLDADIFDTSSDSEGSTQDSVGYEPSNSKEDTTSESKTSTSSNNNNRVYQPSPSPARYRPSMVKSATLDNSEVSGTVANGDVRGVLQRQKKIVLDESDLSPGGGDAVERSQSLVSRAEVLRYHPTPPVSTRRLERNLSRDLPPGTDQGDDLSRASGPVFARIIRCNSCKELRHNVSLSPEKSKDKAEKKLKSASLKRQSSFENIKALLRRKLGDKDSKEPKSSRLSRAKSEIVDYSTGGSSEVNPLTQSLPASLHSSPALDRVSPPATGEAPGGRQGIGSRLAQKANSLKDRMFGTRARPEAEGNARLGSLVDIIHSGFLQHKHLLKWIRVWCVVANGHLYAYRSCFPAEAPITSVLLKDCSMSMEDGDKSKRPYCLKLCQLNVRGMYFADDDHMDFNKWVEVLTAETSTYESFQHGMALSPRESFDSMNSSDSQDSSKGTNPAASSLSRLTNGNHHSTGNGPVAEPLKIKIPPTVPKGKPPALRARSQNSFFDGVTSPLSVSSPRSAKFEAACVLQETALGRNASSMISPSYSDGQESGFSSWTGESHLRGGSLAASHTSQDSLSVSPGPQVSDTDSDYPDSTFDDDIATPDSISSSLASSMTSPGLQLSSNSLDASGTFSPRMDNIKARNNSNKELQSSQLHMLKTQVKALPDKPKQQSFNKALNGQREDESAVITNSRDGTAKESPPSSKDEKRHLLELKRMSLSDGNLPAPILEHLRNMSGGGQVSRAPVPLGRAARDISSPVISGYLDRKHQTYGWDNVWCVIKDGTLFIYSSPIDESAMDAIWLAGYEIRLEKTGHGHTEEFILELWHEDYMSELYRADCADTMERWRDALEESAMKVSLEGLNLEEGGSVEFDNTKERVEAVAMASEKQWEQELLQMKKQQLLDEVLGQKHQLEAQLKQQDKSTDSSVNGDEKIIKEVVHLKQRKASLNIKMSGVQRALSVYQNQRKKKKFRLPGAKSPKPDQDKVTPDEEFLEQTMKELTSQLSTVEKELESKIQSSRLLTSLPEHELRSYSSSSLDKEPSSPVLVNGKSKDKKNKYSGALKFLNPSLSSSSELNFRRRANTYSPGNKRASPAGSTESLKKKDSAGSNESLKLLKNLNDVGAQNAAFRHSWAEEKNMRSRASTMSASSDNVKHAVGNGVARPVGNGSLPTSPLAAPLPLHPNIAGLNRRSDSEPSFQSLEANTSFGSDLTMMMGGSRDSVPHSPDSGDRKEVSSKALAHIAEFEELLRENNVPLL